MYMMMPAAQMSTSYGCEGAYLVVQTVGELLGRFIDESPAVVCRCVVLRPQTEVRYLHCTFKVIEGAYEDVLGFDVAVDDVELMNIANSCLLYTSPSPRD
eukprot:TRINITY_DN8157_c0_g1_i5.p3 TRINITY_DN8157_c0_g1~~TRINITY_DN8157_c0_g1_i5.p3  ORF type:complete len:100 (+),score=12.61 TRINITY_DN8157_c0_g1_i5:983-1282(+)